MANRYTNLGYSSTMDIPLMQLPFKEIDALLGSYQKQKLATDALATQEFKNLTQDQKLANEVRDYQKGVRDNLETAFKSGNTDLYMATLKSAATALQDLRSPSGVITALESRIKEKAARDKKTAETYKNNPEWAKYHIATDKLPDINYSTQNRTYNVIPETKGLPKYIDPAEIEKRAQNAVKALKESFAGEGYSKAELEKFTTLHDFTTIKGITPSRIEKAVLGALTDEDLESLRIQENIDRYKAGKKPNATTADIYPVDENGKYKPNFLGRLMQSKTAANAIQNVSHKYITTDDDFGLFKAKKELEEQNTFLTGYGLISEQHATNFDIKSLFPTSDETERYSTGSNYDIRSMQGYTPRLSDKEAKKNALDSFNKMKAGTYKGSHPFSDIVANALEDEFMYLLDNKGVKGAREYLQDELEKYQSSNVNNDFMYKIHDPASRKRENEIAFKHGDFLTKEFITVTPKGGKTKTMSQAEYAKSKGYDLDDPDDVMKYRKFLIQTGVAVGESLGDGADPIAPYSQVYSIGNDQIRAGTGSIENANIITPSAIIAESFNTNRPSEVTSFPLVPELYNSNGQPRRVQLKPKTITKRDVLIKERKALYNNISRGTGQAVLDAGNRIMQINEELQKMSNNPSLNGLTGKNEYLLYDYDTGELLGDEKHVRELLIVNKQNGDKLIKNK